MPGRGRCGDYSCGSFALGHRGNRSAGVLCFVKLEESCLTPNLSTLVFFFSPVFYRFIPKLIIKIQKVSFH